MTDLFQKKKLIPCKCPVYGKDGSENRYLHVFNEKFGNAFEELDVLILFENKEDPAQMLWFSNYAKKILKDTKYQIRYALGCTYKDYTKNQIANFSACKKHNIKKIITELNPKVIVTVGKAIYTITEDKLLQPDDFYSLNEDDTWFYAPEFKCKILPLPPLYLWYGLDVWENKFSEDQLNRAIKYSKERRIRVPELKFHYVKPENHVSLLKEIANNISIDYIAVDTESKGLNYFRDPLISIQLSWDGINGYFFRFLEMSDEAKWWMNEIFECKLTVMQNGTYDIKVLWRNKFHSAKCDFDILLAKHTINENSRSSLKAGTWIYSYYGGYEKELKKYLKQDSNWENLPESILLPYACTDPCVTLQIFKYLKNRLDTLEGEKERNNFYTIKMPSVPTIAKTEYAGIPTDEEYMREYSDILVRRKVRIEKLIRAIVGHDINVNSKAELTEAFRKDPNFQTLTDDQGNEMIALTKALILNKETIPQYAEQGVRIAKYIVKFNQICKDINSIGLVKFDAKLDKHKGLFFEEELKDEEEPEEAMIASVFEGRLHSNFNLAGTTTARLSSSGGLTAKSKINLQNQKKDKFFRKVFKEKKGWLLGQLDFRTMEVRIGSQISGPGKLEKVINEGKDIHCDTLANALTLQGKPQTYEEVFRKCKIDEIPEYVKKRDKIKPVNFQLFYVASDYAVSKSLKIPLEEVEIFSKAFKENYPEYQEYIKESQEFAKKNGYVYSLLGNKRHLPELTYIGKDTFNTKYKGREAIMNLLKVAVNFRIQSTSGQTTLIAMTKITEEFEKLNMKSEIVGNVHDAIWLHFPEEEMEQAIEIAKKHMKEPYYENVNGNTVLQDVDVEIGTYGFGTKYEKYLEKRT